MALHGLDAGLAQDAGERYLEGAEDVTTTLDALYERARQEAGAEMRTRSA